MHISVRLEDTNEHVEIFVDVYSKLPSIFYELIPKFFMFICFARYYLIGGALIFSGQKTFGVEYV